MGYFDDLRAGKKPQAAAAPTADGQAAYESARANFEAARPDIEAGKLKAYPNWRSAEVALEGLRSGSFDPEGDGYFDQLRRQNGLTTSQRQETPDRPIHRPLDAGMMPSPGASPVQMLQPNVARVQDALRQAQVTRPLTPGAPLPAVPETRNVGAQPQPAETMLASRGARQQTGEVFQIAGRAAIELGGVTAAGRALKAVRPLAGPVLKAGATALGSAAGSLAAEVFDPSQDPGQTAALSAVFSGLGDGLALGFSALRKARSGAAATRPERLIPGGARAVELLGEGNLPTPGRLVTTPTVDTLENIAETGVFGGTRVKARNERAAARAGALIRQETAKYARGLSRADVDTLVTDVVEGTNKAYREAGDALYRELDGLAAEGVSTQPLIDLRNAIVKEFREDARAGDLEGFVKAIDRVLGVPPSMRGIRRGVILDSKTPVRAFNPKKPGSTVIEGGDRFGQLMDPTQAPFQFDNTGTFEPFRGRLPESGGSFQRGEAGGWVELPPNAADTITFAQMNSLRSAMQEVSRAGDALSPTVRMGQAKRIAAAADDSLQTAGAALRDPEAFAAWREANRFWKDLHATFNDNVMIALANSRPDDVFNTIMQADSPQQIARFRKMVLGGLGGSVESSGEIRRGAQRVLKDPQATAAAKNLARIRIDLAQKGERAWTGFQGRFFAKLLENANKGAGLTDEGAKAGRQLQGDKLLDQWNAFGADAIQEVFPSARQRRNAQDLFRTLEIVQAGTGSSTARMATQFGQAGSVLTFMIAPGVGSGTQAVTMLFGPAALAKLFDNEQFARWLITAKRTNPGSEAHARAVAQAAIAAAKAGARVVDSNGVVMDLEQEVPKAREARELLDLTNRR